MENYNENQRQVIEEINGPMLVIAGPGTGKTYTIVQRVKNMIKNKIPPEKILITTFTNKAVRELKERIQKELSLESEIVDYSKLQIYTFHSFCSTHLEKDKIKVIDEIEQLDFVVKNIENFKKIRGFDLILSILRSNYSHEVKSLVDIFNKLSEFRVDPNTLLESGDKVLGILGVLYSTYLGLLERKNYLDFSLLQSRFLKKLNEDDEFCEKIKSKISHILVDEYQDTNSTQSEILLKLLDKKNNICVVGDDDQSIYRFRGSDIGNILNFPSIFPKNTCKIVNLKINYRSTPEIIEFYKEYISNNKYVEDRYKKELYPSSISSKYALPVLSLSEESEETWIKSQVELIKSLKEKNIIEDYSQIVYLTRSVKSNNIKKIINALNSAGISTYAPRSGDFFKRKEIKLLLGIIISLVKDYAKDMTSDEVPYILQDMVGIYRDAIHTLKNKKEEYVEVIEFLRIKHSEKTRPNFLDLFYEMMKLEYFGEIFSGEKLDDEKNMLIEENISIFLKLVEEYEKNGVSAICRDFLDEFIPFYHIAGIKEFEDENRLLLKEHISFLTLHQSKGLEFDIVFLESLHTMPSKKDRNDIERKLREEIFKTSKIDFEKGEESDLVRLYYTGFSRAKEMLVLTYLKNNTKNKESPSSFFREIAEMPVKISSDMSILDSMKKIELDRNRIKNSYSFTSDFSLYEECSMKYRFHRLRKFPSLVSETLVIGTLLHNSLEDIHKYHSSKEKISKEVIKKVLNENYEVLKSTSGCNLSLEEKKWVYDSIVKYSENSLLQESKYEASELEFSDIRGGYILKGVPDLIRSISKQNYEIVDFKSARNKSHEDLMNSSSGLYKDSYKKQLLVYKYLAEKSGYRIKNLVLHYFLKDEEFDLDLSYSNSEIDVLLSHLDSIAEKIERKEFKKTENTKLCKSCNLKYYCRREE